jgi:hypothetical protein
MDITSDMSEAELITIRAGYVCMNAAFLQEAEFLKGRIAEMERKIAEADRAIIAKYTDAIDLTEIPAADLPVSILKSSRPPLCPKTGYTVYFNLPIRDLHVDPPAKRQCMIDYIEEIDDDGDD